MSVTSITARLPRVEDRLLLHKQMIESLPSALFVCDAGSRTVVEQNSAAAAFFDGIVPGPRPLRSLIGREARDFFPDFEMTLEPLFDRAVQGGRMCSADELRLTSSFGVDRFVAVTVQPMGVDNSLIYLMVTLSDVTQKVAARERQQYLTRMESVGTLAGGLAHDVNNMLFAIGGHAYLLRARPELAPESLEELDRIDAAITRARALTGKLLTFARGAPDRSLLQVNDVVTETLKMLAGSLGHEVAVHTSLDPDLPAIHADSAGLQQILMNLCVNARDAMEGHGRLGVRTARENGAVLIEVSDSGSGIPDAVRARIFEPFFTTKREHGTGLGLSVVYGLVMAHGGTVAADNVPGGGARFCVRLPAGVEA